MTDKPKPKREVAVSVHSKEGRIIFFNASQDATNDFAEFGSIKNLNTGGFYLNVDPRFDFDEVLAYIENYG